MKRSTGIILFFAVFCFACGGGDDNDATCTEAWGDMHRACPSEFNNKDEFMPECKKNVGDLSQSQKDAVFTCLGAASTCADVSACTEGVGESDAACTEAWGYAHGACPSEFSNEDEFISECNKAIGDTSQSEKDAALACLEAASTCADVSACTEGESESDATCTEAWGYVHGTCPSEFSNEAEFMSACNTATGDLSQSEKDAALACLEAASTCADIDACDD